MAAESPERHLHLTLVSGRETTVMVKVTEPLFCSIVYLISINPSNSLSDRYYCYPHCTDVETEVTPLSKES